MNPSTRENLMYRILPRAAVVLMFVGVFFAYLNSGPPEEPKHDQSATVAWIPVAPPRLTKAEAACVSHTAWDSVNRLADDDELNSYIRLRVWVYYRDCGRYEVITGARVGFVPNYEKNQRLDCRNTVIDRVNMDIDSIAGQNPRTRSLQCKPGGARSSLIDLRNTTYGTNRGDRTAHVNVKIVKTFLDRRLSGPTARVPN